jgi:xanthine/uracil permease
MFSTLICVFTLDRIGRRWTLYWGSVGMGIAMFLAGGMSKGGIDAKAAGNDAAASAYGIAAASFVFLFTFVFGATWLTVPWLYPVSGMDPDRDEERFAVRRGPLTMCRLRSSPSK